MLLRNAYPSWILDRIIKRSINTFMHPSVKYGPKKERLYIGLPYLGSTTEQVRRSIKQINKQFIPHKDVIVYFKPGLRISNFFRGKDNTPIVIELQAHIIDQYTCADCNFSQFFFLPSVLRSRAVLKTGVQNITLERLLFTIRWHIKSALKAHAVKPLSCHRNAL